MYLSNADDARYYPGPGVWHLLFSSVKLTNILADLFDYLASVY